jgi:exopolysaccharide biosynthesis polyprenyl glycosylphosphotransferase
MTTSTADVSRLSLGHDALVVSSTSRTAPSWPVEYVSLVVVLDCLAIFVALAIAIVARFGITDATGPSYEAVLIAGGPLWVGVLAFHRTYDARLIGHGPTEWRNVLIASVRLFGIVAIACYAARIQLARGFVAIACPVGVVLLLAGRHYARRWLAQRRQTGSHCFRVLAVGDKEHVDHLVKVLERDKTAGYTIVGACLAGGSAEAGQVAGVPVVGDVHDVATAVSATRADSVAVTAANAITPHVLRRMSWQLQDTGINMLVAPGLTDIAGNRISVRPVSGLPLLHIDEPELGLFAKTVKRIVDVTISGAALAVLIPVFAAIAISIKATSRGPVLFRQKRVGREGEAFMLYKFRTMHVGAEALLTQLRQRNDSDGLLFKMRDDPRVTTAGKRLRRLSLDELPQLLNVLKGDMSLVGPRPPLQTEVDNYDNAVSRRLRVKPGITGLWQVSGRSDLSWEESVRLDLYYVENWALSLDLVILARTARAVCTGAGAY